MGCWSKIIYKNVIVHIKNIGILLVEAFVSIIVIKGYVSLLLQNRKPNGIEIILLIFISVFLVSLCSLYISLFYNNYFKIKKLKKGDLTEINFDKIEPIKDTVIYSINLKNIIYITKENDFIFINKETYDNNFLLLLDNPIIRKDWKLLYRHFNPFNDFTSKVKVLYNSKIWWIDPRCLKKLKK